MRGLLKSFNDDPQQIGSMASDYKPGILFRGYAIFVHCASDRGSLWDNPEHSCGSCSLRRYDVGFWPDTVPRHLRSFLISVYSIPVQYGIEPNAYWPTKGRVTKVLRVRECRAGRHPEHSLGGSLCCSIGEVVLVSYRLSNVEWKCTRRRKA